MAIESLLEIEADGQGDILDPDNQQSGGGLTVYGFEFERMRGAEGRLVGNTLTCRLGAGKWVPQLLIVQENNENLTATLHTYKADTQGAAVPEMTWTIEGGRIAFIRFEQPETRYAETANLDHLVHLTITYQIVRVTHDASGAEAQLSGS